MTISWMIIVTLNASIVRMIIEFVVSVTTRDAWIVIELHLKFQKANDFNWISVSSNDE